MFKSEVISWGTEQRRESQTPRGKEKWEKLLKAEQAESTTGARDGSPFRVVSSPSRKGSGAQKANFSMARRK